MCQTPDVILLVPPAGDDDAVAVEKDGAKADGVDDVEPSWPSAATTGSRWVVESCRQWLDSVSTSHLLRCEPQIEPNRDHKARTSSEAIPS